MAFPKPEVGLVISYSYLWREEAEQGHVEGRKTRPCAIVIAMTQAEGRAPTVTVAPITHTLPDNPNHAVEIPPRVKQYLGLDEKRAWIVLDDFNVFTWPGFDLRPVPKTDRYDYGFLPPRLFDQIRKKFLELVRGELAAETSRDEA
jgi:hypothetical protein